MPIAGGSEACPRTDGQRSGGSGGIGRAREVQGGGIVAGSRRDAELSVSQALITELLPLLRALLGGRPPPRGWRRGLRLRLRLLLRRDGGGSAGTARHSAGDTERRGRTRRGEAAKVLWIHVVTARARKQCAAQGYVSAMWG